MTCKFINKDKFINQDLSFKDNLMNRMLIKFRSKCSRKRSVSFVNVNA